MLTHHDHEPGLFDAGHCHACADEAGLLDHYWHVQREEASLREARQWARQAHREIRNFGVPLIAVRARPSRLTPIRRQRCGNG